MKTLKQTFVLVALAIGMSSCASVMGINKNIMMKLHKGMTQDEVSTILGQPDYRRFDNETEEWEFVKYINYSGILGVSSPTTIVIGFVDGRLVSMDSFERISVPPVPVYPAVEVGGRITSYPHVSPGRGMREIDFQAFYNNVRSKPFKDDQLMLVRVGAQSNTFTCSQCVQLMSIYTFDDDKLEVLKIIAPRLEDRENYSKVIDALAFISSQEKARAILGVKR